ncbi:hypothetical protein QR680_018345 [Steinernema hermaphroditum]|uniref:Ubiquitin-like protease family profile domain-containing protein n=1 Tax=Steinernema hermaphroditum TaxID=289476 RepID=A0AA39HHN3_9BILA|nr:hypothetical protein QR680_018345 [Steinernema hermaphroditum]
MKTDVVVKKARGEPPRKNEENDNYDRGSTSSVEGALAKFAVKDEVAEKKAADTTRKDKENLENSGSEDDEDTRRLPDDVIDRFCDKLQKAMGNKIDGMLAMQYITLEPDEVKKHISGKKQVLQVLFDRDRDHYVVVEWDVRSQTTILYDSLPTKLHNSDGCVTPIISESISQQIVHLFLHLYTRRGRIPLAVHTGIDIQKDSWSCGYRALANVCLRARQKEVGEYTTLVRKVDRLAKHIDRLKTPTLDDFDRYTIYQKKDVKTSENPYVGCYVLPDGTVKHVQPQSDSSDYESELSEPSSSASASSTSTTASYSDDESEEENPR